MHGEERRALILERLKGSQKVISASRLAEEFSVTRQIIVADIALLRAAGHNIRAEHRGYVLESETPDGICKRVVVKHEKADVKKELFIVVDHGGKVKDVIVEHPIYGTISASLNLSTRYDVEAFVKSIQETGANPLSLLTEGVHIHTISVPDEQAFERIVDDLQALGILIESA